MDERIDYSRFTGGVEHEGVNRQKNPDREIRPQSEKERAPDYTQRRAESAGRSEWSGGSMGGGTWAGRSR
jgi:hypothetical protein